MLVRVVGRLSRVWESLASMLSGRLGPPPTPALALAQVSLVTCCRLILQMPFTGTQSPRAYGMEELVRDMRILLGVPKFRTSKPKKVTRKFSYTRLYEPSNDVTACTACGSFHELGTICAVCYEKVRQVTNDIKRAMMAYNPYKGEKQDKEVHVKFNNDVKIDDGVINGKRVLEIDKPRPSWFKTKFEDK